MILFLGVLFGTLICGTGWAFFIVWLSNPDAPLFKVLKRPPAPKKLPCGRIHLGPETAWTNGAGIVLWRCGNCGLFMNSDEADSYFKTRKAMLESMARALRGARVR